MNNLITMLIVVIPIILSSCTFYGAPNGDQIQVTASGIPAKIIANNLGANKTVITQGVQTPSTFVKENPGILVIENEGTEFVESSTTVIEEKLLPIDTKTKVIEVPSGTTSGSYYHKDEKIKYKSKPSKTKYKYEGSTSAGSGTAYYYYNKSDAPVSRHR